jgi:hypothetical protein
METRWLRAENGDGRLWNLEVSIDIQIRKLDYITMGIYKPKEGDTVKITAVKTEGLDKGSNVKFYTQESEINKDLIDRIYYTLLFG